MTNTNPKYPGKTYGPHELAQAQADYERARLGSSYASKKRTEQMIEKINQRRENAK